LPSDKRDTHDNEKYLKTLESTIKKFLEPIKDVSLNVVIKATTGYSIIPFDKNDPDDVLLLSKLTEGLQKATETAFKEGIFTKRPNEVGNQIEPFVRSALNSIGVSAGTPRTRKGDHKAVGYPDLEIHFKDRITYLECKTYNISNADSSLRAFYLQPSENSKITANAHHLMVGFEIESAKRTQKDAFVPIKWRLYSLHHLKVQVKHEFNASNQDLYQSAALIAEGRI